MRKLTALLVVTIMMVGILAGCAGAGAVKYGMVTDAGTIDDKSFNQGTWEGIVQAGKEFKFEPKYNKPANAQPTEADYLKEISNLYDAGYRFIETPGFKFETALFQAQEKYKDCKFVLFDGTPNNGKQGADYVAKVGPNTVSVLFDEQDSGFLAGVATALQLKEGEVGFIGGMEIPAVQKFNWGFQQGIKYANANLGTTIVIKAENVVYEGTFNNVAGGQTLAAGMFDKGVKAIFCAAGGVGVGAINEAKARATAGKEVWIIGVDLDQYKDGIYDAATNKSIILTSAMKEVKSAAYDLIKLDKEGKFPGGQTVKYGAKNGGVRLPDENPNLSKEVQDKMAQIFADMKAGKITVSDQQGDLFK